MRANFIALQENLLKFVDSIRARDLVEFSNFLNVCRYNGIDNFLFSKFKQTVI